MKKLLFVVLLVLTCQVANAQKDVFKKYKDVEGITIMHLPKYLLRMGAQANIADVDMEKIVGKIDELRILHCMQPVLIEEVKQNLVKAYQKEKYEEVTRKDSDEERVAIYVQRIKREKNDISIMAEYDGMLSVVNITGNLSLEDLQYIDNIIK